MAASMENNVHPKIGPDISVFMKGGSNMLGFRPLFSRDSKCLFIIQGSSILVYNTNSGEHIRQLCKHTQQIVGIQIYPRNHLQLVSCSSDGTVIHWDYTDGVVLKEYNLQCKVFAFFMPFEDNSICFITKNKYKDEENIVLLRVRFSANEHREKRFLMKNLLPDEKSITFGNKGEYVAAVNGEKLYAYHVKTESIRRHLLGGDRHFTCIAAHPTETCLATGDDSGRILLWYNFMIVNQPAKSVLHWHSLPVTGISFTVEGSHLYSVGGENVLVKWTMGQTQHREFLPRLGAPIKHLSISSDSFMLATCHLDNSIQIISSHLTITQVIQGITHNHVKQESSGTLPVGLVYDSRSAALVLNGKVGHLQFYSVQTDKQLYNLDIVGQNVVSGASQNSPIIYTEVERAAFSDSGQWLATVQRRADGWSQQEISLKFWQYDNSSQTYLLNTKVDLPHMEKVNKLLFQPGSAVNTPLAVTTSDDTKFKIWGLVDDTDIYRERNCWACESCGYYKSSAATEAAFSDDGSLLAVVFDQMATLWTPENNALKVALSIPGCQDNIRHVLFGNKGAAHLLLSGTQTKLVVWNLLTFCIEWCVELQVVALAGDPMSDLVAGITKDSTLYVYRLGSSTPVYTHENVSTSPVLSAIFLPNALEWKRKSSTLLWQQTSQLYFMNENQELLTINESSGGVGEAREQGVKIEGNLPLTPFGQLLAKKTKTGVESVQRQRHVQLGNPGSDAVID
ncbi:PREDICTED: WD repeat-containing protein 75-like isoform X2 [Priapulus caudatus]|nr:PREDICTED: WD repeat-containing protein 75-like isoform X2 [Priapulus caudatus]